MENLCVMFSTYPDLESAQKAAVTLVEQKLAACINLVGGLTSVYIWEGELKTGSEVMLMIKTSESCAPDVTRWIESNHPYDVAEVISLPMSGGSEPYLHWLQNSLRK